MECGEYVLVFVFATYTRISEAATTHVLSVWNSRELMVCYMDSGARAGWQLIIPLLGS